MKTNMLSLFNAFAVGMLIIATGCQEKVAPELSDGAISATGGAAGGGAGGSSGGVIITDPHNFSVTLGITPGSGQGAASLPSVLNYRLHKVNELAGITCNVPEVIDTPDVIDSSRDITCFVEAEENVLHKNGIGLTVNNDKNTCDYVVYEPASFLRYQPGMSARKDGSARAMLKFECTDEVVALFGGSAYATDFGTASTTNTTIASVCNRIFNIDGVGAPVWGSLDMGTSPALSPQNNNQKYCSFDYSIANPAAPNCDPGRIMLYTYSITAVDGPDVDDVPDTLVYTQVPEVDYPCQGNVNACVEGAVRDVVGAPFLSDNIQGLFVQTDEASSTVNYQTLSPYVKKWKTNMGTANFTRQCSGISAFNSASSFAGSDNSYNQEIIDAYSMLGVDVPILTQEKDARGYDIIILGDDPLRAGLPDSYVLSQGYYALEPYMADVRRVKPFHTFTCLDKAYDVKARIRVAVREWNRQFNVATASFAPISDVDKDATMLAFMDATHVQPMPGGLVTQFNDLRDWDDFLRWDDTLAPSCLGSAMLDYRAPGDPGYRATRSRAWFPEQAL